MRVALVLTCVGLLLGACRQPEPEGDEPAAPARIARATTPAEVTPADFQTLRWLEGRWRGTGDEVDPFYEEYQFVSDSSIRGLLYSDSTLTQVADSSWIVLSAGVLEARGANSLSVATEIDSQHVRFEAQRDRDLEYTWTRVSADEWSAFLRATILGGTHERTYRMVRIGAGAR